MGDASLEEEDYFVDAEDLLEIGGDGESLNRVRSPSVLLAGASTSQKQQHPHPRREKNE